MTFRIPNLVSIALLAAYLAIAAALGTAWQIVAIHLACGLVVLVIGFALFELRMIGGGDAKLAAAAVIWLGVENLSEYVMIFSLIGGAFAVAILSLHSHDYGEGAKTVPLFRRIAEKATNRMPYGVPLGLAALLIYPHSQIWRALAGA